MSNCPKVTGISPKEGAPRTKLTIRGENLGTSQDDIVSVKICDIECLIFTEWHSSQKIITRSPHCVGVGEVIITTKSGGLGLSMIQFRAYEDVIGPTTSSSVWIDESDKYQFDLRRNATPNFTAMSDFAAETTQASKRNISDKTFSKLFPDLSLNNFSHYNDMLSEQFHPMLYLIENFQNSSFDELRKVYNVQLNKCNSKTEDEFNSNAFLKANVMPIMDCLNALNAFYTTYKRDRLEFGAEFTTKLEDYVGKANTEAHSIFDDIIARKDKSDSTRNALNVLQRYRFLFNLPSTIDKGLLRKDYDVVINDYFRAKNLFANSNVKVFRKVYQEVEQRIEKFTLMLKEDFQDFCVTIDEKESTEELRRLIKYLTALEPKSDPAWEGIQLIHETLITKVEHCRELCNPHDTSVDLQEANDQTNLPPKVKYIDDITKLFNAIFIKLFNLGVAYLNGELFVKLAPDTYQNRCTLFKEKIVIKSLKLLCEEYSKVLMIGAKVHASPQIDPYFNWLPYCLRCVVDCYSQVAMLDFPTVRMTSALLLKDLQTFIADLRMYTMNNIFNKTATDVEELCTKETWVCQLDDMYGVRSRLPLLFETKVIEMLQLIRDSVLQIRYPDEGDMFSLHNVKGSFKQLTGNVINAFLKTLGKSTLNPMTSESNIAADNRSLIILCNCSYTINYVLPKLYEAFEKYGFPDVSTVIQKAQRDFKDRENKLLIEFIERKRDQVIGMIEPAMYMFDDWTSIKEMPRDVSYFVKEVIFKLIFTQAEIYQVTPHLVNKTMFAILLAVIEEIKRLYESCIDSLSDAARIQMLIDVNAIDYVFQKTGKYFYPDLKERIDGCRRICNASVHDQTIKRLIDEVTDHFCDSMRLQICCFNFETFDP